MLNLCLFLVMLFGMAPANEQLNTEQLPAYIKEAFSEITDVSCYTDDDQTYFFITRSIGNPLVTEIYIVEENGLVAVAPELAHTRKTIDRYGHLYVWQDAYDIMYDRIAKDEEGLWTGHSNKSYEFFLKDGKFTEIDAKEITREEVEQISPFPKTIEEILSDPKLAATQFILRENGELKINLAYDDSKKDSVSYRFECLSCKLGDKGWDWLFHGDGYYYVNFSKGIYWDYINTIENM